ncbi:MAG: NAD(P)H-dependent oxidoreductase subunit E [Planctomycetes bacterium]|nr:NAD(P)H-dependent oxidoreductase subunit E [Planctomycetota bacterium]
MPALNPEIRRKIESYLPRYPSKQAVTLPALHIVHDEMRCVSNAAIEEIAEMLDLAPAEVQDTMSFYEFFHTEEAPMGKTRLWVCRSLACALRGGDELLSHLCRKLNVQPGDTTADGKITLEFAECLGACEGAPAVMIDDEHEHNVTPEAAEKIVERLRTPLAG